MVDIARVGGPTQWMKVAAMAEANNLPIVSHVMPEIWSTWWRPAPTALPSSTCRGWWRSIRTRRRSRTAHMVLTTGPGLGLTFDEKAIAAFKA